MPDTAGVRILAPEKNADGAIPFQSFAPQLPQNFLPGDTGVPHSGQNFFAGAPAGVFPCSAMIFSIADRSDKFFLRFQ